MRVHHLNCATMCPYSSYLVNGPSYDNTSNIDSKKLPFLTLLGITSATKYGFFSPGEMVCHCLLIETNEGLILVDTGIGLQDIEKPTVRLGKFFVTAVRPKLDREETAAQQILKLGFKLEDVKHIFVTHLDLDHAGGLSDFPKAKVHVFETEYKAAMNPISLKEKNRYRSLQWEHKPDWAIHSLEKGETWFGFDKVQTLVNNETEILLVPLVGHSRGHCAIAVKTKENWLLHCGDGYFFHGEMSPSGYHCTPGLWLFQNIVQVDPEARINNQERLRRLVQSHSNEVKVFCAHDKVELTNFQNGK